MDDKTEKLIRQGSTEKESAKAHFINVRFSTEEEKKQVEESARNAGFGTAKQSGASSYIKSVALGHNPPSIFDQKVIIEVCRLHGALGKISRVIEQSISEDTGSESMSVYLRELLSCQREVKDLISDMRDGKFKKG